MTLLAASGLVRTFAAPGAPAVHALRGVDLSIQQDRTLGVIGESGSGKSTLARLLLLLDHPTAGEVLVDGQPAARLSGAQRRDFRRRVQPVFQNPYASLNPRMSVGGIVGEPLLVTGVSAADRRRRVASALESVGLSAADATKGPSQFSGGQRQRIAIARAIAVEPSLLILDEPVASLDLSIRAQILALLKDLRASTGMGMVIITHDLRTLGAMCDDVAVMYLGRIVEHGLAQAVIAKPRHPYTRVLFASSLSLENARAPSQARGDPPSPSAPPPGCSFHPRCPAAFAPCSSIDPRLTGGAACHAVNPHEETVHAH